MQGYAQKQSHKSMIKENIIKQNKKRKDSRRHIQTDKTTKHYYTADTQLKLTI